VSLQMMRRKMAVVLERCGSVLVSADQTLDGSAVCDEVDDDGDGWRKWSVHCAAVVWTLSADHCRWSRDSPRRSSCHSPRLQDQHHLLLEPGQNMKHVTDYPSTP